jgi:hypothetical protein
MDDGRIRVRQPKAGGASGVRQGCVRGASEIQETLACFRTFWEVLAFFRTFW